MKWKYRAWYIQRQAAVVQTAIARIAVAPYPMTLIHARYSPQFIISREILPRKKIATPSAGGIQAQRNTWFPRSPQFPPHFASHWSSEAGFASQCSPVYGTKVCRIADTTGTVPVPWPGNFQIKYSEAILSNSTRKLLWFMLSAVLKDKFIASLIIGFRTLSFPICQSVAG